MEIHRKPKSWHSWREFVRKYAIVVIGLLKPEKVRPSAVTRLLQRFAERQPGPIESLLGAFAFAAFPAGVGAILGFGFGYWACFAVYLPAILLAALLLGWRAGLLTALLSAVESGFLLSRSPMPMGLTRQGLLASGEYWVSAAVIIATAALLRRSFAQLKSAAEREHALNLELRHRVNNSLALALAFASQTMKSAPEPEVFYANFRSRLMALARAQDILSSGHLADCRLPHLAETALEAFGQRDAISLRGVPCSVPSISCVPLVLALHELATNAVKHGALSAPRGRVSLSWTIGDTDKRSGLVLQWLESGGPPVERPTRQGLGSRLLVRQSGLEEVSVEYDSAGVRCTIFVRGVNRDPATQPPSKPHLLASL
jgi:two-component sensor histidine kinase